jgi:hypothetical protein
MTARQFEVSPEPEHAEYFEYYLKEDSQLRTRQDEALVLKLFAWHVRSNDYITMPRGLKPRPLVAASACFEYRELNQTSKD